jgi:hypothetical protein
MPFHCHSGPHDPARFRLRVSPQVDPARRLLTASLGLPCLVRLRFSARVSSFRIHDLSSHTRPTRLVRSTRAPADQADYSRPRVPVRIRPDSPSPPGSTLPAPLRLVHSGHHLATPANSTRPLFSPLDRLLPGQSTTQSGTVHVGSPQPGDYSTRLRSTLPVPLHCDYSFRCTSQRTRPIRLLASPRLVPPPTVPIDCSRHPETTPHRPGLAIPSRLPRPVPTHPGQRLRATSRLDSPPPVSTTTQHSQTHPRLPSPARVDTTGQLWSALPGPPLPQPRLPIAQQICSRQHSPGRFRLSCSAPLTPCRSRPCPTAHREAAQPNACDWTRRRPPSAWLAGGGD